MGISSTIKTYTRKIFDIHVYTMLVYNNNIHSDLCLLESALERKKIALQRMSKYLKWFIIIYIYS